MNPDDQLAATASGLDGTAVPVAWPDAAEAAREAASRRLRSLVIEDHALPEDLASATSRLALRSVDDELAALVYDSMIDDDLLANVRSGAGAVRQLTFAAADLVLEVEVSGARYLVGQVVPPQAAVVELRHRGGNAEVETDALGCFHVPVVPDGPVSFRCRTVGATTDPVATSWITF